MLALIATVAACAAEPTYVPPPVAPGTATPVQAPAAAQPPKAARIGDPVKDGKLTFTVTKVENGPARIGDQYLSHDAEGRFLYVHVTVFNHASEAQQFVGSAQKLLAAGREYSADDQAGVYLKDMNMAFAQLNPGIRINTLIVYDIPKDVQPEAIRFHDSLFSGGVTVAF